MTKLERFWRAIAPYIYWLVSGFVGVFAVIGLTGLTSSLAYSLFIPTSGERVLTQHVGTANLVDRLSFVVLWILAAVGMIVLLPRYQRAVESGKGWQLFLPVVGAELIAIGILLRYIRPVFAL